LIWLSRTYSFERSEKEFPIEQSEKNKSMIWQSEAYSLEQSEKEFPYDHEEKAIYEEITETPTAPTTS